MSAKKNQDWHPHGRWITARRIVQYLALALFIVLFLAASRGMLPADWLNLPFRINPLIALSHLLASRTFLLSSSLALIVFLSALVIGRAWCGWLCPLGTILDFFPFRKSSFHKRAIPEGWRSVKYGLLIAILVAALLGNLTLLIFDPITILTRSLTIAIWPALDQLVSSLEQSLFTVTPISETVARLDTLIRPAILPIEPLVYRRVMVYFLIFFAVVAANFFAPRFWCRYLCPLGALLALPSKLSLFRRQIGDDCKGCTLCTRSCPTGTIDPAQNYASDPAECTLCMDCLEACPRSSIAFNPTGILKPAAWKPYDPSRRQALWTIGATLAGLALLNSSSEQNLEHPFLIRPPGGRENDIQSKCVRCAACMRACPTGGLQPAIQEAGLSGLWTPVLTPRIGYCDYSCNACGQICPVQAIPALNLEQKRQQIIGKAYIDENRCIAWADRQDCIVCEEMCPVAEKAIILKEENVSLTDGSMGMVKLPQVIRERCIGCGICEYKCPVNGLAAIQVYVPGSPENS